MFLYQNLMQHFLQYLKNRDSDGCKILSPKVILMFIEKPKSTMIKNTLKLS